MYAVYLNLVLTVLSLAELGIVLYMSEKSEIGQSNKITRLLFVRAAPIFLLVMLTIGLFEFVPRYEISGPDLLKNGGFEDGLEGWVIVGVEDAIEASSGVAILKSRDSTQPIAIQQRVTVEPGMVKLQLNVEIFTNNISQGIKSWHLARVYLIGFTAKGEILWNSQRAVAQLSGDTPWRGYSDVIRLTKNMSEVGVGAQIAFATGDVLVRNLRLHPVKELAVFQAVKYALIIAWVIMLIWVSNCIIRSIQSFVFGGAAIVIAIIIMLGALIPGSIKGELKEEFSGLLPIDGSEKIKEVVLSSKNGLYADFSQLMHFAEFFVLAILIRLTWAYVGRTPLLIGIMFLALISETIQFFAVGRQPAVEDWLLDIGGGGLGMVVIEAVRYLSGRFYDSNDGLFPEEHEGPSK